MGIDHGDDVGAGEGSMVEPVGLMGAGPTLELGSPVAGLAGSPVGGAVLIVPGVVEPEGLASAGSEPSGSIA